MVSSRVRGLVGSRIQGFRESGRIRRLTATDPELGKAISWVHKYRLSYLSTEALSSLADAVRELEENGVRGELLEAGTALGGSALVMTAVKSNSRPLRLYDTFSQIPPPSERDGEDVHARYEDIASGKAEGHGGDVYYGYRPQLMNEIRQQFRNFGLKPEESAVHFVQGVYQETLWPAADIALAHIDCDWYDSVMTCLTRIHPKLVVAGRFIIDDYDGWSGARDAVNDFLRKYPNYRVERRVRLHLVREA